ncbi:hypothetical protein FACS1894188_02290 [Clostridia bacterium]|nr:hypothetical protein FACS1894188_02290 [Clostridia bacterium]
MKCAYLNGEYGCNRVLMATGTPITNSMTELYVMTNYLRPDLLQTAGIENFDDWASNFGEVVTQLEMKPAGNGYKMQNRFAKFNNLPELMAMYKEFADIQNAEDLHLPVPNLETGEIQIVVAQPTEFQIGYMRYLAERAERMQNGRVDPKQDNMLKVTHEARLLGLDGRTMDTE